MFGKKTPKFETGDIVNSGVNFNLSTGKKIGFHKAIVIDDNGNGKYVKTRLITHCKGFENEPIPDDMVFEGFQPDGGSFWTGFCKSVVKFMSKPIGKADFKDTEE